MLHSDFAAVELVQRISVVDARVFGIEAVALEFAGE